MPVPEQIGTKVAKSVEETDTAAEIVVSQLSGTVILSSIIFLGFSMQVPQEPQRPLGEPLGWRIVRKDFQKDRQVSKSES